MSKIKLDANASGTGVFTIASPNSDSDRTLTLPDKSGTVHVGSGIDDNADAIAITVDSSERVGIGLATPLYKLQVAGASSDADGALGSQAPLFSIQGGNANNQLEFGMDNSGATAIGFIQSRNLAAGAQHLVFNPSGGNVFVGTSDTTLYLNSGSGNGGIALSQPAAGAGRIDVARAGNLMTLNRLASDGEMMELYKDGGLIGQVNSYYGDIAIGHGDTGLLFNSGSDQISPFNVGTNSARHNAIDLGASGARFNDAYVVNGVTSGSDEREKQEIAELDEAETRVAVACKGLLRKWRWKDAVEAKDNNPDSDEVARIHFGIIAQELKAAFEAEGLDAGRYGMFIHSTWTDKETGEECDRMGIRYSELLAFIIAAI